MIIRVTSILFFLTCFGNLFSQSRFSITPLIENSFQYTKQDKEEKHVSNNFYTIKKLTFTKPFRFSPLSIGFLLNCKMRNNWKISMGITQGGAMLGYGIYFQGINTFKNPIDTTVSANRIRINQSGVMTAKLPLYLSKTIFNTDSIKLFFKKPVLGFSLDVFGGISYQFKPRGTNPSGIELLSSYGMDSIPIYPNQYLSFESKLFAFSGNSLAYHIGFNLLFKTNKKREVFSLRCYYTYSRKTHAFESVRITVNNTHFVHTFAGTGSGIYLQLSRSFNVPKRKKKTNDNTKFLK